VRVRVRHRFAAVASVAALTASGLATATAASAAPVKPDVHRHSAAQPSAAGPRLAARSKTVGSLELHACAVVDGALCGSVRRPWEPARPSAGTVKVGFAFAPARDTSHPALGTVVPHEGGPGYSTTGR
jgi:hypothetical protein